MTHSRQQLVAPSERKRLLLKYLAVLSTELRQMDTTEPLFHGCWDWHSAVHGHLAMLLGSQAMGWQAQVDWMTARLQSEALDQVFERLVREPHFERPYGRSWLLYLVVALERCGGGFDRWEKVHALADELAQWLEPQNLGRGGKDYQEPCFVLSALQAWYHGRDRDKTLNYWNARIENEILANPADPLIDDEQPGYFFSRWALQVMVIQSAFGSSVLKQWIDRHEMVPLAPISEYHSIHHMGINASRSWGLSIAFEATQDRRWMDCSIAHIKAADALHAKWQGDRHAYSHWLPQFTVLAILGGPLVT